ncbi:hypothetical protein Tco_0569912 [Tanacetum coccineum]
MESQSETTQTVSALKLPVLKTGEYDLWSMRMEQYLTFTDHALWEWIFKVTLDEFGRVLKNKARLVVSVDRQEKESDFEEFLSATVEKDIAHQNPHSKISTTEPMTDLPAGRLRLHFEHDSA